MISCKVIILLVVIEQIWCSKNTALVQNSNTFYESLLCRDCGNDVSSTKQIISNPSPKSQYSFYDKVFSNEDILVQTFVANLFFEYPLIFTTDSGCTGIGEWEESSWFPGYISRPCICPECGAFIGWVFQPSDIRLNNSEVFFGLILPNIIGETCEYVILHLGNAFGHVFRQFVLLSIVVLYPVNIVVHTNRFLLYHSKIIHLR